MLDLCLINPPTPGLVRPDAHAALSLMYVAGAARDAGASVGIFNLAWRKGPVEFHDYPIAKTYGITGYHIHSNAINRIARRLKERDQGCRVVVGGPVCLSQQDLDLEHINTIVYGAGETVIQKILTANGARFIDGGNASCENLPKPARDLWDGPLGEATFLHGKRYFEGGSCTLLTSRGCPNNCAFCANAALTGRTVSRRDPDDVVSEMEIVVTEFGIREFTIWDETFNSSRKHVIKLCDAIMRSKVFGNGRKLAWRVTVAAKPSDSEMWARLKEAGCREISVGLESGDNHVLKAMGKHTTVADHERTIREAHEAGLTVRGLMICGTPAQRPETLQLDMEFVERNLSYLAGCAVHLFYPVPGCAIQRHPEDYGCMLRKDTENKLYTAYGPDGLIEAEPHVDINGMSRDELRRDIRKFLAFMDGLRKLHHG